MEGDPQVRHEVLPVVATTPEGYQVPCIDHANQGDEVVFRATGMQTRLEFNDARLFNQATCEFKDNDCTLRVGARAPKGDHTYKYILVDENKELPGNSPPYIRIIKDPPTRGGGGNNP